MEGHKGGGYIYRWGIQTLQEGGRRSKEGGGDQIKKGGGGEGGGGGRVIPLSTL